VSVDVVAKSGSVDARRALLELVCAVVQHVSLNAVAALPAFLIFRDIVESFITSATRGSQHGAGPAYR